jgi:hypothetical protein
MEGILCNTAIFLFLASCGLAYLTVVIIIAFFNEYV